MYNTKAIELIDKEIQNIFKEIQNILKELSILENSINLRKIARDNLVNTKEKLLIARELLRKSCD